MNQVNGESLSLGTVMAVQANYYFVCTKTRELLCTCRSRLKKIGQKVIVGDRVKVIEPSASDDRGSIIEVLPRQNELDRPAIANVGQLLLLFALQEPPLDEWQLSRFLVTAELTGIKLTVCLNKTDLVTETEQGQWRVRLQQWGYDPLFISLTTHQGIDQLLAKLTDQTTIMAGPSGVGKSTLTNYLIPSVNQRVGAVSGKLNLGRHTTRHVELFPLPQGGFLADSPGFNRPYFNCTPSTLALYFPEARQLLAQGNCQFSNCLHRDEPNCIVRGDWERYEHYLTFLEEIIEQNEALNKQSAQESSLKLKVKGSGEHYYEPKLESKKYRRISRKKRHQILDQTIEELEEDEIDGP